MFNDFEAAQPTSDDIHSSVVVFLHDGNDFSRAADLSYSVFDRSHNTERRIVLQTLADHFLVARLKDMQRQSHAGKEHDIERKEGEKVAHRSILNEQREPVQNMWCSAIDVSS